MFLTEFKEQEIDRIIKNFRYINRTSKVFQPQSLVGTVNTNFQTPGHTWGGPPKIINNRLENARSAKSALRRSQTIPPKTCYLVSGLARLVDRAHFIKQDQRRVQQR